MLGKYPKLKICCINQRMYIGTRVITGASSVVTKNIPSYFIAVGN